MVIYWDFYGFFMSGGRVLPPGGDVLDLQRPLLRRAGHAAACLRLQLSLCDGDCMGSQGGASVGGREFLHGILMS